MAVKASVTITISKYRDTDNITRYYKLQASTASKPAKPATLIPSGWTDTEPTYTSGSTNTLYFTDRYIFSDGTFQYTEVSKSTSYEAAKEAYNKAKAAQNSVDDMEIGGRNLLLNTNFSKNDISKYGKEDCTLSIVDDATYGKCLKAAFTTAKRFYYKTNNVWVNGQKYGISFMIKTDDEDVTIRPSRSVTDYADAMNVTLDWQRYTGIIYCRQTIDEGTLSFSVNKACTIYITLIKLEKGNKCTDWTPAPEDIDKQIYEAQDGIADINDRMMGRNLILNSDKIFLETNPTGDTNKIENNILFSPIFTNINYAGKKMTLSIFYEASNISVMEGEHTYERYGAEICFKCNNGTEGEEDTLKYFVAFRTLQVESGVGRIQSTFVVPENWTGEMELSSCGMRIQGVADGSSIRIYKPQLELGEKSTEWSQAPEDVEALKEEMSTKISNEEVEIIKQALLNEISASAQQTIDSINATIKNLVRDKGGHSMMTQTSTGWAFEMGSTQAALEAAQDLLATLEDKSGDYDKAIDDYKKAIAALDDKTAYIKLGTDSSNNPTMILGRDGSPFKVVITNTSIDFMNNQDKPAYVSGQIFYGQNITAVNQLKIGNPVGFIWKIHNGNLGLVYTSS